MLAKDVWEDSGRLSEAIDKLLDEQRCHLCIHLMPSVLECGETGRKWLSWHEVCQDTCAKFMPLAEMPTGGDDG